jgi:hypothetical protein
MSTVFWDVRSYSLVAARRMLCFFLPGLLFNLKMQAVRSSETSVSLYQTLQRHLPENSTLQRDHQLRKLLLISPSYQMRNKVYIQEET